MASAHDLSDESDEDTKIVPIMRLGRKDRKIGHRRVDKTGTVTYKRKPTSELMQAIQLGINQFDGRCTNLDRDILMQDFEIVQSLLFPCEGSNITPAHTLNDFLFKAYAPNAFRMFRQIFRIAPEDYLISLCSQPLQELSNPGASGSVFYMTEDDRFVVKTVQKVESKFLQKLMPAYYISLIQAKNKDQTLLPKFYGLYRYHHGGKNIRFVTMNNLLPSHLKMHEKYDLKGSTYKRSAGKRELSKSSPTLKDLDFRERHPNGLFLEAATYEQLMKSLQKDLRLLESFNIMDYSLLVGIHILEQENKEPYVGDVKSDYPPGSVFAWNEQGQGLLLYIGLIDILQRYRVAKQMEHTWKSVWIDGDTISVHKPNFYAKRFYSFISQVLFRKSGYPCHIPSSERPKSLTNSAKGDIPLTLDGGLAVIAATTGSLAKITTVKDRGDAVEWKHA